MLGLGAERQHDVPGERVHALEPLGGVLLAHHLPDRVVLVRPAGDRGAHEAELLRLVVGDEQQLLGAVRQQQVLGVVLDARAASTDRARW